MTSPNSNYDTLLTTTLANFSRELKDNVTKNIALLNRLDKKGKMKPFSGGTKILEELEYGEGDLIWYNGFQAINYSPKELFTAAEFPMKLCAVPIAISGEEQLQNSGKEQILDLFEKRYKNGIKTMKNKLSAALYSDGTGSSGKEIGGLKLLVADDPTTGTVGNINRATSGNAFWRNQSKIMDTALTKDTIRKEMDALYLKCCRGVDKPDLIVADNDMYSLYNESLSDLQRFTNPDVANAGFVSLKYKGADVIFDGGQGGACPEGHMYFLNTDYIYLRTHKDRDMKVINGDRMAVNQDALYRLIGWAGNLTTSNASLQGVLVNADTGSSS